MGNDAFSRGIARHKRGERPSNWSMDRSIQSLKNCLGQNDDDPGNWSSDISQPTTQGGIADLASGIKAHHEEITSRLEGRADAPPRPYGDVKYADPANGKYPLDTLAHCKAAWSYIHMPRNASKYSPSQLAEIKSRIRTALKAHGVNVSEDNGGN